MWDKQDGNTMFREIVRFKKERKISGFSIMEIILMYCEEMERDVEEVGALLKKDKNFKETLQEDLKFHNEARFEDDKKQNGSLSEWI